MGVPRQQANRNRQAIIETAARIFRERGVDGVGVADLMKEAGFTHGGFYNHFASKDALAAAACASAFALGAERLSGALAGEPDNRLRALRDYLAAYLSPEQCAAPGLGCPTATLAVDAARQGADMQAAYAQGIESFLTVLAGHFAAERSEPGQIPKDREDAIAMLTNLVGAMVLARGVGDADRALSNEILAAGRRRLAG